MQGVTCFYLDRSLKVLVTGSNDSVVRLWNPVVTKQPMVSLFGHKSAIVDVIILQHLKAVISCAKDGVSRIYCGMNLAKNVGRVCLKFVYMVSIDPLDLTILTILSE